MILLLETIHNEAHQLLEADHEVCLVEDLSSFTPSQFQGVRAIVTRGRGRVTAEVLEAFKDLEVVARCGVGLDNIDLTTAAAMDIAVVHAPGSLTAAVAEHAVLLMLAVSRRLVELDQAVQAGNWAIRDGFTSSELCGKRLGIVGLGAIGSRIADIGLAFGMEVVCSTRRNTDLPVPRVELDELIATSDVIQLCLPLTDDTRCSFDADVFRRMKSSAVLINIARGGIVDHDALGDALEAGELAGYGADVWEPEPPAVNDRLVGLPTTVVTPHIAALTDVTYREICMIPAASVLSVLAGSGPIAGTRFG